ncbi:MAG: sugar phosphate isomerase/epimerase [Kiritimatiellae bacterium]|nr:sugar phosphate isomerase/epimerase [Kiritimatiellia bacterium]
MRAIGDLARRAEELGVLLAIENTRSPHHIDAVLSAIGSDHLGLCYDSSHDFISGHSPCALLKKWGGRLMTTHLSDNNGINDDHYLPGDGRIDWDVVEDAFPKTNYSGALLLEVVPRMGDGMKPEQFVRAAFSRAELLREKIGQLNSAGDVSQRAAP